MIVAVHMLRLQLMGVDMAVAVIVVIDLMFVFHVLTCHAECLSGLL